jgi:poly(beta-D-mannuronate) lyase
MGNLVFGAELLVSPPSSDTGFVFADPKLRYVEGMYRPAADSPVINRSVVVDRRSFPEFVAEDVDGQMRDRRPDIGADEVTPQRVRRHPLTAADVGPDWMKPPPPPRPSRSR